MLIHDLEEIQAGLAIIIQMRLDGWFAVGVFLRKMKPEAGGDTIGGLTRKGGSDAFNFIHKFFSSFRFYQQRR
jgi:hypothetical protein